MDAMKHLVTNYFNRQRPLVRGAIIERNGYFGIYLGEIRQVHYVFSFHLREVRIWNVSAPNTRLVANPVALKNKILCPATDGMCYTVTSRTISADGIHYHLPSYITNAALSA